MERLPTVSVITVVLNAVAVIERTLQSVVSQDYPHLEYIVVDGGSTDGTEKLIGQYSHRISRWVSEKDGGIYEAMNKGAAMASGEWILFMNGGDVFAKSDVIARTFSGLAWKEADVIYGDGVICHEGYRIVERAPDHITLTDGNGFSHQSSFMRTELQKQYGFDVTERIAADYDLFLRLYKDGKVFRRADVVISEFFTGGFSNLPPGQTIRLRHRVYTKHFSRAWWILYLRLARLAAKNAARGLIPAAAWERLKRLRDRNRFLSDDSRPS
ncbi:MAG: glycosyltransferase family 2 protein [Betaproteobacteria bacterium]